MTDGLNVRLHLLTLDIISNWQAIFARNELKVKDRYSLPESHFNKMNCHNRLTFTQIKKYLSIAMLMITLSLHF